MTDANHITIHHQDGICVYPVARMYLQIVNGVLNLEVEAGTNKECPLGFLPEPTLYVEDADVAARSIVDLGEEKLLVPFGWDDESGEEKTSNIFRIYIGQHQSLDNNVLQLRRLSDASVEILWQSDAPDFNYYDGRAKRNKVDVRCVHRMK